MSTWCNNCTQCMSEGCYDTCGIGSAAEVGLFVGLVIGVALATAALVGVLLLIGHCIFKGKLSHVARRAFVLLGGLAGGIPILVSHYFYVASKDTFSELSRAGLLPPCITSWVGLGLWASGYDRTPTADFLAPCGGSEMAMVRALRAFGIMSLVAAVLMQVAIAVSKPAWPVVVLLFVVIGCSGIAIAVGESLLRAADFCGSGHSLAELGFGRSAGLNAFYATVVMHLGAGLAWLLHAQFCPPTDPQQPPADQPQQATIVEGQPVIMVPGSPGQHSQQQPFQDQPPHGEELQQLWPQEYQHGHHEQPGFAQARQDGSSTPQQVGCAPSA